MKPLSQNNLAVLVLDAFWLLQHLLKYRFGLMLQVWRKTYEHLKQDRVCCGEPVNAVLGELHQFAQLGNIGKKLIRHNTIP